MQTLTREQSRQAARRFINDYVRTMRQWNTSNMELYLPEGYELRDMAEFCDRTTVSNIASFLQSEAVPA